MTYRTKERIGAKRHRVDVQQPSTTLDAEGQPIVTWTTVFTDEPASFETTGGIEAMRGRQLEASVKGIFRVNYRSGYTPQMRVVHDGISYGILYVNPIEGGRREIELFVAASGDVT